METTVVNVQITPKNSANHYWDDKGVNQELFDDLTDSLMPAWGEEKTLHAEMIRAANRLAYDYCNNGNCNVLERIYDWDEDYEDEIEVDRQINSYYENMLDLLEATFMEVGEEYKEGVKTVRDIQNFILIADPDNKYYFSDENMAMYDRLIDYVLLYITNTEDSPLDFQL